MDFMFYGNNFKSIILDLPCIMNIYDVNLFNDFIVRLKRKLFYSL